MIGERAAFVREVMSKRDFIINDCLGIYNPLTSLNKGDLVNICVFNRPLTDRETVLGDYFYVAGYVEKVNDKGIRISNVNPNYCGNMPILFRLLSLSKPFIAKEDISELERITKRD